jgi:hypothetical protein
VTTALGSTKWFLVLFGLARAHRQGRCAPWTTRRVNEARGLRGEAVLRFEPPLAQRKGKPAPQGEAFLLADEPPGRCETPASGDGLAKIRLVGSDPLVLQGCRPAGLHADSVGHAQIQEVAPPKEIRTRRPMIPGSDPDPDEWLIVGRLLLLSCSHFGNRM